MVASSARTTDDAAAVGARLPRAGRCASASEPTTHSSALTSAIPTTSRIGQFAWARRARISRYRVTASLVLPVSFSRRARSSSDPSSRRCPLTQRSSSRIAAAWSPRRVSLKTRSCIASRGVRRPSPRARSSAIVYWRACRSRDAKKASSRLHQRLEAPIIACLEVHWIAEQCRCSTRGEELNETQRGKRRGRAVFEQRTKRIDNDPPRAVVANEASQVIEHPVNGTSASEAARKIRAISQHERTLLAECPGELDTQTTG